MEPTFISPIDHLPAELLERILLMSGPEVTAQVSGVSRTRHNTATSPRLWRSFFACSEHNSEGLALPKLPPPTRTWQQWYREHDAVRRHLPTLIAQELEKGRQYAPPPAVQQAKDVIDEVAQFQDPPLLLRLIGSVTSLVLLCVGVTLVLAGTGLILTAGVSSIWTAVGVGLSSEGQDLTKRLSGCEPNDLVRGLHYSLAGLLLTMTSLGLFYTAGIVESFVSLARGGGMIGNVVFALWEVGRHPAAVVSWWWTRDAAARQRDTVVRLQRHLQKETDLLRIEHRDWLGAS